MSYSDFFIGVVLAVVLTSESLVILRHVDRPPGTRGLARWRLWFAVAIILAAFAGVLRIGGYV